MHGAAALAAANRSETFRSDRPTTCSGFETRGVLDYVTNETGACSCETCLRVPLQERRCLHKQNGEVLARFVLLTFNRVATPELYTGTTLYAQRWFRSGRLCSTLNVLADEMAGTSDE